MSVRRLTTLEAHNTYVAFERAVFRKLTLAYVLNAALLPLVIALLPHLDITQAWFEDGGVVAQSPALMLAAGAFFPSQALQPLALLRRHVQSRHALSQPQLDRLWAPPPILFAETYASIAKSIALCLVYAPFWPLAYGLTAATLLFSYGCFRAALRYWYARPPPLNAVSYTHLTLPTICSV